MRHTEASEACLQKLRFSNSLQPFNLWSVLNLIDVEVIVRHRSAPPNATEFCRRAVRGNHEVQFRTKKLRQYCVLQPVFDSK